MCPLIVLVCPGCVSCRTLTPVEEASRQNQKLQVSYEARVARLAPGQASQKTSLVSLDLAEPISVITSCLNPKGQFTVPGKSFHTLPLLLQPVRIDRIKTFNVKVERFSTEHWSSWSSWSWEEFGPPVEPLREGATSVDDGALLLISEVQLIGPGSGSFVTIPILGPEL